MRITIIFNFLYFIKLSLFAKNYKRAKLIKIYKQIVDLKEQNFVQIKKSMNNLWNNYYCKYEDNKDSKTLDQIYGGEQLHLKSLDNHIENRKPNLDAKEPIYSKCTNKCLIPNGWANRIHKSIKRLYRSLEKPNLLIKRIKQILNPNCCKANSCSNADKCKNIIKYINNISVHYKHVRTLRRVFYSLKSLYNNDQYYSNIQNSKDAFSYFKNININDNKNDIKVFFKIK